MNQLTDDVRICEFAMDIVKFDKLVQALSGAATRRQALVIAGAGLAAFLSPRVPEPVAARNRNADRRRRRRRQNAAQPGDKPDVPNSIRGCANDPATGAAGFECAFSEDGCSCGGACCAKGYSCFVEENGSRKVEICCYSDTATEPPQDAKHIICPNDAQADICCDAGLCRDGVCHDSPWISSRYRRKWR